MGKDILLVLVGLVLGYYLTPVWKFIQSFKKKPSEQPPDQPGPDVTTQDTGGGPKPTKPV